MRVTTELWTSALTRRVFGHGGFAAIVKRGAMEAGAVFLTVRDRLGQVSLYGPASQSAYESAKPDERLFSLLIESGSPEEVDARLLKEQRFDPDIWVVELEPGNEPLSALISLGEGE